MDKKIKAAIVGGAGYTGGEMLRLLIHHPQVELVAVQSDSNAGNPVTDVHTDLFGDTSLVFTAEVPSDVDVLFLCMGHGKSKAFLVKNKPTARIIDLGNDFRLEGDRDVCGKHFVYGLVDSFADEIAKADNVANPGCFATAIQTALMPLAKASLLTDDVHITAVTGATGAGQSLSATSHFPWRENNLSTYKNFSHQHLDEIAASIRVLQQSFDKKINFIPYRGDFNRGIFATLHTLFIGDAESAKKLFKEYYAASPFVHVTDGEIHLKQVVNTNKCILKVECHDGYILITSVIDNLLKGAAGQAVENMNLMFGLEQASGLKLKPSAF